MTEVNEQEAPRCYLDMDGVIVDYMRGMIKGLSAEDLLPFVMNNWPEGVFSISEALCVSDQKVETVMANPNFWKNLDTYVWADRLIKTATDLFGLENVFILTSPGTCIQAWTEKYTWILRKYPQLKSNVIMTRHKYLIRGPGVLIDDKASTCQRINHDTAKGRNNLLTLCFPQPWNKNVESIVRPDSFDKLLEELKAIRDIYD